MKKRAILALLIPGLLFSSLSLVSCGEDNPKQEVDKIDYAKTDEKIRLQHDYKGKNFFQDGIAQVNLKTLIDGDTAHFVMADGSSRENIKIRYYGVDTPESTGAIEPYGDKAKNFNKEKLEKAQKDGTIVVTSTCLDSYEPPETDSTGSRYLGMVWINEEKKNAPYDEMYLLNLMLVQEGYSYVKAVDKFPAFKETFYAAEEQAKKLKLNLFSGEPDDSFNYGDYQTTNLREIQQEVIENLKDPNHANKFNNAKVRVRGTVAGFTNKVLYLQARFEDEETGEIKYAGINVFTGMSPISSKYTTVGNVLELCGTCKDNETFGFQISGATFPKIPSKDPEVAKIETKVLYKADEAPDEFKLNTFKVKANELSYEHLFNSVSLEEEFTVTGGYVSDDKLETTLFGTINGQHSPIDVFVPFSYTPDGDSTHSYQSIEEYKGKTFKVSGIYNFHTTSKGIKFQILPRSSADLVLVK